MDIEELRRSSSRTLIHIRIQALIFVSSLNPSCFQVRRVDAKPSDSDDYQRLADIRDGRGPAVFLWRGSGFLSASIQQDSPPTDNRGHCPGGSADLNNHLPLREAGDPCQTRHQRLVQAAGRLLVGLRADQGEHLQLCNVRVILVAVRYRCFPKLLPADQHTGDVQLGLVRPLQVLLQQSSILRGRSTLSQRLRQAVPLLLLQDHGEFLEENARRRRTKHQRPSPQGSHYPFVR